MYTSKTLDILFLTNFSDYCYRAIPALAQLASTVKIRLTLFHVYDPVNCGPAEAAAKLNSFFPEADRYAVCRRVTAEGELEQAVRDHITAWPVNLILAPASDDIGLPRLGHRSMRARLIRESGVPVWTIGRKAGAQKLTRSVENVACWLDLNSPAARQLEFATEYAARTHARLHLLCALPDIHEGTLALGATANPVLAHDQAVEGILARCGTAPVNALTHIVRGEGRSTMVRMLRECDADVAFFPEEDSSLREWLGMGLAMGDAVPCSAIYVGSRVTAPVWTLEAPAVSRQSKASWAAAANATSVAARR